ncbi:hypothetical protein CONPUDRAFT_168027, partial [Coniophora puteana RWD-64-598 SS2]
MHRALDLPEILRMICDELNSIDSTDNPKQQLESKARNQRAIANVARVCRTFKDPALDILWSDVEVQHFLKLLPSKRLVRDDSGAIIDVHTPSPNELRKVHEFTRRTRTLTVGSGEGSGRHVAGTLLHPPVDAGSVFPKLRHLVVQDTFLRTSSGEQLYHPHSTRRDFLLPWLTTAKILAQADQHDCDTLLLALPEACPSLQNLVVDYPDFMIGLFSQLQSRGPATKALTSCIRGLPNILSLCCPDLEDEALEYVFQRSKLQELTLTNWKGINRRTEDDAPVQGPGNQTRHPPTLSKLLLCLPRPYCAIELIPILDTLPISLELDSSCEPMVEEVRGLFDALGKHPGSSRLQKLVLNYEQHPFHQVWPVADSSPLQLRHLRPAFLLQSMRSFRFCTAEPILSLTSDDLLEIAQAWPNLEEFCAPYMDTEPGLCLHDVLAFAEACPKLTELEISITNEPIDFGDTAAELSVRNRNVKTLRIYDLHHGDLPRVSVVLARAFPNLAMVQPDDQDNFAMFDSDRLGDAIMVAVRKLRAEEARGKIKKWTQSQSLDPVTSIAPFERFAMHHALALPEILRMICGELNTIDSTDEHRQQLENKARNRDALASVAKVCRAFKGPALDALWSDIDQARCLLELLPPEQLFTDGLGAIIDVGSPSPDELGYVYEYSRRVRKLTVGTSIDTARHAAGILVCPPVDAASVFPRLRHLVVFDTYSMVMDGLPQTPYSVHRDLLLPWLTTVELRMEAYRRDCDALLLALPAACPGLRNLVVGFLDFPDRNASVTKAMTACIFGLPSLMSLRCPDLEDVAFAHALKHPKLQELNLTDWMGIRSRMEGKVIAEQGPGTREPHALSNLSLRLLRLSDATDLIPALTTMPSSLELDASLGPKREEVAQFFDVLVEHPGGSQLQKLVLGHKFDPFWFSTVSAHLHLCHIRPALHLHSMRSFRFGTAEPTLSLTSDDLFEIAQAWPNLEEFCAPYMDTEPGLCLHDVLAFTEACPQLTELAIRVTNEPFDFGDTAAELSVRNRNLKTLRIYYLHYGDLPRVSVVLARAFPSLAVVQPDGRDMFSAHSDGLGNAIMVAVRKLRAEEARGKIKKWTVRFLARRVEEIFLRWRE